MSKRSFVQARAFLKRELMRESQSSSGTSMKEGRQMWGSVPALEQALENKESFAVASLGARVISSGVVWRFSCVGGGGVAWRIGAASQRKGRQFFLGELSLWNDLPIERMGSRK